MACRRMDDFAAGFRDVSELFAGVYAVEEAHGMGHVRWRVPWRGSSDDWLGRGERPARQGRVAAVFDFVFLAISTLSCNFVDVPRRLRTRGNSNAAGGGSRWDAHISADHHHCRNAGWCQRLAVGARTRGRAVLLWCIGGKYGASAGLSVGCGGKDQCSCKMADARHDYPHSCTARIDGVRQDRTIISGIARSTYKCFLLTPR